MSLFNDLPNRIVVKHTTATKSLGVFAALLTGFIVGVLFAIAIWLNIGS